MKKESSGYRVEWYWIAGVYTVLGILFAGEKAMKMTATDWAIQFNRLVGEQLIYWVPLALITPLIFRFAHRHSFQRDGWAVSILLHGAFFLVMAFSYTVWVYSSWNLLFESHNVAELIGNPNLVLLFGASFITTFVKYCLIVFVYYALDYYRQYREKEKAAAEYAVETSQLQAQLSKAKLDAFRVQLHPHFLFNTLNSISVLIEEEPEKAVTMLEHLGDLLRYILEHGDEDEVPFAEELTYARMYLEIEQIRFEDRLSVTIDVPDETLGVSVPNLILQPLVENAIKHGVAPSSARRQVRILATVNDTDLMVSIEDNGPGFEDNAGREEGIGLKNTRARLARYTDNTERLTFSSRNGNGAIVTLRLPRNLA